MGGRETERDAQVQVGGTEKGGLGGAERERESARARASSSLAQRHLVSTVSK